MMSLTSLTLNTELIAYVPAFLSLSALCLMVLIQSFLTAPLAFINQEQIPGMPLNGNHELLSFRALRTYSNSVETLPTFGLTVLIAILIGVSSPLVNWLAMTHLAFRLVFWVVYYSGVGKVAGGVRSLSFVGGLLSNGVLTLACVMQLIG